MTSPSRRRAAVVLAAAALAGACASAPRQSGVVPVPRPFPGGPVPGGSTPAAVDGPDAPASLPPERAAAAPGEVDGYALVGTALGYRGTPYVLGGADPRTGFDCSGFTQFVFARYGVALPREVVDQYKVGTPVQPEALQPGDLLFFRTETRGASHVAIAIGGDQFVHAPNSRGVVRVERLGSSYWGPRFLGARRISAN